MINYVREQICRFLLIIILDFWYTHCNFSKNDSIDSTLMGLNNCFTIGFEPYPIGGNPWECKPG